LSGCGQSANWVICFFIASQIQSKGDLSLLEMKAEQAIVSLLDI
jgi:hypothetical protein